MYAVKVIQIEDRNVDEFSRDLIMLAKWQSTDMKESQHFVRFHNSWKEASKYYIVVIKILLNANDILSRAVFFPPALHSFKIIRV